MRFTTHTILIAAAVATTLAAGQPDTAFADQVPMTADEKREKSRLSAATRATLFRKKAEIMNTYAEECEAAFVAGEVMPEPDIRVTETIVIDQDLKEMTTEEISEQYGLASDATREARKSMNDCILKFRKRDEGS